MWLAFLSLGSNIPDLDSWSLCHCEHAPDTNPAAPWMSHFQGRWLDFCHCLPLASKVACKTWKTFITSILRKEHEVTHSLLLLWAGRELGRPSEPQVTGARCQPACQARRAPHALVLINSTHIGRHNQATLTLLHTQSPGNPRSCVFPTLWLTLRPLAILFRAGCRPYSPLLMRCTA